MMLLLVEVAGTRPQAEGRKVYSVFTGPRRGVPRGTICAQKEVLVVPAGRAFC